MATGREESALSGMLQELLCKTQLLGCLNWLHEFRVFACIPDGEASSFEDVAELANIPCDDLIKVVRYTTMSGILSEPLPGYIAHSFLSAQFLQRPSLLEAVSLVAKDAIPAMLDMPAASRSRSDFSTGKREQCYEAWLKSHETDPKFRRRLTGYQRWQSNITQKAVADAILSLGQASLDAAVVVDVNATNMALTHELNGHYPGLRIITQLQQQLVQHRDVLPTGASVQAREPGTPQPVQDAALYILRLPSSSLATGAGMSKAQMVTELRVHFNVLVAKPSAVLLLVVNLVQHGRREAANTQAFAQAQDLFLFQMANEQCLDVAEIITLIDSIRDADNRLVVVKRLSDPNALNTTLELGLRSRTIPCDHVAL